MLRELFQETVARLLTSCQQHYGDGLVSCAVFGSVARGTPNPSSDIDMLLVATAVPSGRMQRMKQFAEIEESLEPWFGHMRQEGIDTCVSPIIKTPEEVKTGSLLFLDMIDDALIIFDKDDFLRTYLNGLKDRLTAYGATKVQEGQRWHWVLKPDYKPGEVFEI